MNNYKCSDRSKEVKIPTPLENQGRQTNQPSNQPPSDGYGHIILTCQLYYFRCQSFISKFSISKGSISKDYFIRLAERFFLLSTYMGRGSSVKWKCDFPMNSHVRLLVGWSVCHNFLERQERFIFILLSERLLLFLLFISCLFMLCAYRSLDIPPYPFLTYNNVIIFYK